jgi:hypothetical protein
MKDQTSSLGDLVFIHRSEGHCVSRRKVLAARLAAALVVLGAGLALLPVAFPQTSKPSKAEKTQDAAPILSHDLSGVWMQYPDGIVEGVPSMNAVDASFRPPLTPWGKARFDAATTEISQELNC